jgi:uncharacterized repeat protein (TIGR03809 family)
LRVFPKRSHIANSDRYNLAMSERSPAHALEEVAQKWRALAERRCAYFLELHRSGRWRHYYSEEQFLVRLREAIELSERWVEIAAFPTAAVVSEHAHPVADIATRSAA